MHYIFDSDSCDVGSILDPDLLDLDLGPTFSEPLDLDQI